MRNITKYLPIFAICVITTGCTNSKPQVVLTSGIDVVNLDTTALPGTDFYQYACGGWSKNHPLTDEYSQLGSFDLLAENNNEQLRGLIEGLAVEKYETGSIAQKIGDFYKLAMDSTKLNRDGVVPIKTELDKIASLKTKDDLYVMIAEMYKKGVNPYFYIYVGADDMNSSMNMIHAYQGGLGMGERDYYLGNDEKTLIMRKAYQTYVVNMFKLSGYDEATAQKAMKAVMNIETRLAKSASSLEELRDPCINYNKKTMKEVKKEYASFNWDLFLSTLGLEQLKEINISQPKAMKEVAKTLDELPLNELAAYMQWHLINSASNCLSDDFAMQNFEFYGKTMSGRKEMKPRWKRAVAAVDASLGEAVGQMYVEKYFSVAAKERMVELVKKLQTSLGERIKNLSWMGEETKTKALGKLAAFHVKVGYPDEWKDYSSLQVKDDSYWANIQRANEWEYKQMMAKVGKPVDKNEWHMTPQTVNAYYNPTTNEICFPAGILQYPFFDMNADDAFNYGAIGVVIGHEMTHGFDDQGRKYDQDGNLKDWWTSEDSKKFDERAEVMIQFFDSIQIAPQTYANGRLTLGENLADHGGLQIAYQAFKKKMTQTPLKSENGFTPEQRFFLSYANVWAGNIRPEEILRMTKLDVHSLGKWRVNGALPHVNAWYEAFNITAENPMFIAADKRVSIW